MEVGRNNTIYIIHYILIFVECNSDGPDGLITVEEVAPTLRHSTIGDGNNGRELVVDREKADQPTAVNDDPSVEDLFFS